MGPHSVSEDIGSHDSGRGGTSASLGRVNPATSLVENNNEEKEGKELRRKISCGVLSISDQLSIRSVINQIGYQLDQLSSRVAINQIGYQSDQL